MRNATTPAVGVFCSSSNRVPERDRALARDLGTAIATRGWRLVYGGGDVGLMGEVARAALHGRAHVTGVIPRKLVTWEVALFDVDELIVTETMRERQRIMDERSDAFVVLPGGIGTLAELLEIITLKQLGYHERPLVLLDPDDYWGPLRAQLDAAVCDGYGTVGADALLPRAVDVDAALHAVALR